MKLIYALSRQNNFGKTKFFGFFYAYFRISNTSQFPTESNFAESYDTAKALLDTLGYQLSDVYAGANGNVANIRFIALGTDMDVENVGFKVTANVDGKSWDRNTSTVYTELWGKNAAGVDGAVAKASDYGADFIYGLAIKGIPTDTDITFNVTPYATKNGEIVEGATFRVVVNVPSNTAS